MPFVEILVGLGLAAALVFGAAHVVMTERAEREMRQAFGDFDPPEPNA